MAVMGLAIAAVLCSSCTGGTLSAPTAEASPSSSMGSPAAAGTTVASSVPTTTPRGSSQAGSPSQPALVSSVPVSSVPVGPVPVTGSSVVAATPPADRLVPAPVSGPVRNAPCPGVRCVTIAVSGDVLLHPQLIEQARQDAGDDSTTTVDGMDFFPMLAGQQTYVQSADIGVCHLETPLADPDGPFENYPAFSVPPQVLPALTETGYDACSTASNHTIDQGTDRVEPDPGRPGRGRFDPRRLLPHPGGLETAGGDQHPQRAGRFHLRGVRVQRQRTRPAVAGQHDRHRRDQGQGEVGWPRADLVIVAMHAGGEYESTPNLEQKTTAKALLADPDIDLVYGHHAHVVQPMEKINGKWAIYGLGNNIAAQLGSAPGVQQGLLVRVQFSQDTTGNGRPATWPGWRPTRTSAPRTGGAPCPPPTPAAPGMSPPWRRPLLWSTGGARTPTAPTALTDLIVLERWKRHTGWPLWRAGQGRRRVLGLDEKGRVGLPRRLTRSRAG